MHLRHPRFAASAILAIAVLGASTVLAQTSPAPKPFLLVRSSGVGGIQVPTESGWQPQEVNVYDEGTRPILQVHNEATGISASFVLYPNRSGKPAAAGCRADAIEPVINAMADLITERHDSDVPNSKGRSLAITSYLLKLGNTGIKQHNLYAFSGDAATCAEVHLSIVGNKPNGEANLQTQLAAFNPDLAYQPDAIDYFRIGTLLFKLFPNLAVPYYRASLDRMPAGAETTTPRRVATDQLVLSLGMSGDLPASRAVATKAIAADPDYPMNYYNLACADAEQGDAANARIHLQQAFERKANTIPGETLPDPGKDDSILKLRNNPEFWKFVESLAPPTGKS